MKSDNKIQLYLNILMKHRWLIFSFFITVLFATIIFNFTATPIYEAVSRIEISKENPNLVSIKEVMAVDTTGSDYYQTQYKIIESRTVARNVVRSLNLQNSPEFKHEKTFFPKIMSSVKNILLYIPRKIIALLNTGEEKQLPANGSPDAAFVNDLINRIEITPIRSSRLVDISVEAKDPVMSAKLTNALVQAYIDHNLETKLSATKNAVSWLGERIEEQRKKVETAEQKLLEYKEKNEIITNFSSDAEQITAQKLAQLNSQVIDAEARRVETETRYMQALKLKDSPDMLNSIPEVIDNKLVGEIRKMEVDLYTSMSELSKKYGQNHPKMVAIKLELEDLEKRKITTVNQIINSLRNEYELALAREESLKNALDQQKKESLRMNKMAIQYGVLQREAESSRNMYDLLINRFKETSLTEEMKTGNIRIIDRAEVPKKPVRPKTKQNIILALFVGLSFGTGLAFLIELLDNTFKSPDEVKQYLDIPYLGAIPDFTKTMVSDDSVDELLIANSPKGSIVGESFRGLRTSILFSTTTDKKPQTLMVTGSVVDEGKTVIASNLAITMAHAGFRTILMDCDMRRPKIHHLLKHHNDYGLSNYLTGTDEADISILISDIQNLDIISCGVVPPNPSELINSTKMRSLIETLCKDYACIIIDTPPVSVVSDAIALTPVVDGAIIVIRAGLTPMHALRNTIDKLNAANCQILGSVLNGVTENRQNSYYYQQYELYQGQADTA